LQGQKYSIHITQRIKIIVELRHCMLASSRDSFSIHANNIFEKIVPFAEKGIYLVCVTPLPIFFWPFWCQRTDFYLKNIN